jgi:uncharacterized protein (TIGR02145 family)
MAILKALSAGVFAILVLLIHCSTPESTVKDADGNVYHTVKIGNQVWMVENLRTTRFNDGSAIPQVTKKTSWKKLTTPGYCWYDNDITKSGSKYGALYNWYAVDTKKLSPEGWHVPADSEWDTLTNYLITNGYNYDGTTTGDKIAKSLAAKTDWKVSTEPGAIGNDLTQNNRSSFSALPGGFRDDYGKFHQIGEFGSWWSATDMEVSTACIHNLFYNYVLLGWDFKSHKSCGFSVRLLRDKGL